MVRDQKGVRRLCQVMSVFLQWGYFIAVTGILGFDNLLDFNFVSDNGVITTTISFWLKIDRCDY